jgi:hypothetical protein
MSGRPEHAHIECGRFLISLSLRTAGMESLENRHSLAAAFLGLNSSLSSSSYTMTRRNIRRQQAVPPQALDTFLFARRKANQTIVTRGRSSSTTTTTIMQDAKKMVDVWCMADKRSPPPHHPHPPHQWHRFIAHNNNNDKCNSDTTNSNVNISSNISSSTVEFTLLETMLKLLPVVTARPRKFTISYDLGPFLDH